MPTDRPALRDLRPLREAAKIIPGHPHVATLHRWCSVGVRGVVLRTWVANGQRCTTEAALLDFFEALGTGQPSPPPADLSKTPTAKRAKRQLEAAGIL